MTAKNTEADESERYRAFVENSTEGIWRFDTDEPVPVDLPEEEQVEAFYRVGFLAEANDAFARMYGFQSGRELVGARLGELMPREVPENEAYLRAFVRSGYRLSDAESVEKDRDGNLRHFSNTLTGILEGGMLVRAWGTQRDITVQREAERRAERVAAELRLVTDAAPLLISYVGADLRYRLVNQGYADWFGVPKESIVGRTVPEVIGAAAFERSRPLIERALGGERVSYEALLPYAEGERPRFVHGQMVPDVGGGGGVRGYVAVISDISARREAERERERLLAQFEAVLQTATDGIIVSDPAGNLLLWNPAALAMHGYDSLEAARRHLSEFPDTFALCPRGDEDSPLPVGEWPIARLMRGETFTDLELLVRRLDTGGEFWASYSGAPARGEDGTILLLVLTVRDVSERVRAGDVLRASEARYRRLLDTAMEGILFLDTQAVITRVNQRFAAMLGYGSPEELVGRSIFPLFFPEDQGRARGKWGERLAGQGDEYELRLRRRDGSECWVIGHISVERDENSGEVLGTFSMVTDITERRRAMEALRTKSDEVNAVLESIGDAFFALDESWCFSYVNAEAERLLMRERGDLLGENIWERFPAAVGSEFEAQYRRAARERATVTFQAYYPEPLDSWYDVRAYPSPTGEGLSVYFRNINEERRRQEEREHLLAELQEASLRQRRFLKEMLAGFTEGRLRLCFSEGELPAPLPPLSEALELSGASLRLLRKRLGAVAEGLMLPKERLQGFATAVHEAAVNAVKYGGGGTARVHCDADAGTLQVWVRDQGPGIAEEMIHRAVEQGYTTQGFGHGMFFMQSCADRLYLLSEAGRGTTVVLEMDRTAPEPAWLSR